jgi:acetyltransferase-like isoleucine patch superfamily enzyme
MKHSIKRRMIDQAGLWFAPVTLSGATLGTWMAFARGDLWLLASVPVIVYLWPPLLSRVSRWLWPQSTQGPQPFQSREFVLWQFGHRIEQLYWYFPTFERALRCVPGVYSAWLRLWGAEVGTSVFWGNTRILDRGLLRVGDRVVFGDSVSVMSHVLVRRTGGGLWLRTMDVVVGNEVLVGAHSVLGPGANLADETSLPFGSQEWASLRTLLGSER